MTLEDLGTEQAIQGVKIEQNKNDIAENKESIKCFLGIIKTVEKLAVNMEYMATEQKKTNENLEKVEQERKASEEETRNQIAEINQRPARNWNLLITGILSAIAGGIGYEILQGFIK